MNTRVDCIRCGLAGVGFDHVMDDCRDDKCPAFHAIMKLRRKTPHVQARLDSLIEVLVSTAIGFGVSLVTWAILAWAYGIPMTIGTNLQITAWFTVVSIIRQYVIRRICDGRSPWQAIKGLFV